MKRQPRYLIQSRRNRKTNEIRYKAVIYYNDMRFESSHLYSTKGNATRAAKAIGAVPIEQHSVSQ